MVTDICGFLRESAEEEYHVAADEIDRLRAENEKLRAAMHGIYEVYAGSEGIPFPETCPEAYLFGLVMEMADIAAKHKRDSIRDG